MHACMKGSEGNDPHNACSLAHTQKRTQAGKAARCAGARAAPMSKRMDALMLVNVLMLRAHTHTHTRARARTHTHTHTHTQENQRIAREREQLRLQYEAEVAAKQAKMAALDGTQVPDALVP